MTADIDSHKPLIDKLARKNILVIDDEGLITKTLCDLLRRAGYYADASQNGFDALGKAEESDFDLIISDIKMPRMDGVQMVKKIRDMSKSKNKPDVPVIFITGFADSEATVKAREFGEVILKPFDTEDFLSRVAKYL